MTITHDHAEYMLIGGPAIMACAGAGIAWSWRRSKAKWQLFWRKMNVIHIDRQTDALGIDGSAATLRRARDQWLTAPAGQGDDAMDAYLAALEKATAEDLDAVT